ncbi:MAG: hypothetical protein HYW27_00860 [Candidatus Aenigmarchaeota archaeon]|nr:hypothetical protein [Candidatus Aenigmarchaeota archaeon]
MRRLCAEVVAIVALLSLMMFLSSYSEFVKTGNTISRDSGLPSWARPWAGVPYDVETGENLVSASVRNSRLTVNAKGTYIWRTGYLWNAGTRSWKRFTFPQRSDYDGWARGDARAEIPLTEQDIINGENYVLAYTCSWKNGRWYCGCLNENTCGRWQLQTFTARRMNDAIAQDMSRLIGNLPDTPVFDFADVVVRTDRNATEPRADFNDDGTIDFNDFFLFSDAFETEDGFFDLSNNGMVDYDDFFIFADNFGKKISDFRLDKIVYDKDWRRINICVQYIGNNPESIEGRTYPYQAQVRIPGTSYVIIGSSAVRTLINDDCERSLISIGLSMDQLSEISARYPDGNVPVEISLRIPGIFGEDWIWQESGEVRIVNRVYTDNYEYKIGIVQSVAPGFDLSKKKVCLYTGHVFYPEGSEHDENDYTPIGNGDKDNCREVDISYNIADILFSDNPYTTIQVGDNGRSRNIYSLKHLGKFWENLLKRHGITDTILKKNPRFLVTFLPMIEKGNAPESSSPGEWGHFLEESAAESGLNLDEFDYVVYIRYYSPSVERGFRSFALKGRAYVSFKLSSEEIVKNTEFITTAHELGHVIFDLHDLYDGFGIQYPEGVPDPVRFPQTKACIMAQSFGLERSDKSDTLVRQYVYSYDPEDYVLCVDDIVKIVGAENPNCPVSDFYAARCGQYCTSLNYLSCSR